MYKVPRLLRPVFVLAVTVPIAWTWGQPTSADNEPRPSLVLGAIHPDLSADGQRVVFSYQGAIWRMPSAGGMMTRLSTEPGFDAYPVLSPDGHRIAYLHTTNNTEGALKLIRTETGEPIPLDTDIQAHGKVFFDPDGQRLLGHLKRQDDSQPVSLRWLDLETGELGPKLRDWQRSERFALSHSGERITLVTNDDVPGAEQGGNNGPQTTVWSMRSSGGTLLPLFSFPARIYELQPAPDDSALFVVTDLGGAHYAVWKIPVDDQTRAEKLTFGQGDEDQPAISDDGRWLLYCDNRRGPTSLVIRDLSSGTDRELAAEQLDFGAPTGTLTIELTDAERDEPITARLIVQQVGGKAYAPAGQLYNMRWGQPLHFSASSPTTLKIPVGDYQITAYRGPEYRPLRHEISIAVDQQATASLEMSRWIDQRSRGWYSGESHIHANYGYGYWYNSPRTMLALCAAEDLHVCNMMVANSDGDGVFDREYFRGRPDPRSTERTVMYWNEEFRSTIWGHMTLLNLQYLVEPIFTGFANTTHPHDHPTNADIGMHTHDQDGHVNYTHPAHNVKDPYLSAYSAKELPIDVALGTVDSIDVMGSNHQANMMVWYRLLNCGFEIPASAGTDCFSNRVPARLPGEVRAYVKIDDEFSYERWIDGLKAGRTFATNGPMLELTAGETKLGERVSLETPGPLSVAAKAESQFPLARLELIFNGEVIAAKDAEKDATTISWNESVAIPNSGWLALRAYGAWHRDAVSGQFAHTSPIYVTVQGHPNDPSEDAQYFVDWIDRLWNDVQQRGRILPSHISHVESQIQRARQQFVELAGGDGEQARSE